MTVRNTKAEQARRAGKRPQDIKTETPPPLERDIQRAIITYLRRRGAVVIRVNSGSIQTESGSRFNGAAAGTSDLIALYQGKFIAIEVKRPGNTPTAKQQAFLERVRQAGGVAFVATSIDDVARELELCSSQ